MTPDSYHSTANATAYLSASQIRAFYSCEAAALYELQHPELADKLDESPDVAIGNYLDAALLAPDKLPAVLERHAAVLFLKKGGDAAPLVTAKRMVDRAMREPAFMAALEGKKQHVLEFDLAGHKAKAMLDVCDHLSGKIVDLKTAPEVHEEGSTWLGGSRRPWYDSYHAQLALYNEAYRQNYGAKAWMLLLAGISKQDPPQLALVDFSEQTARLKHEMTRIESYAPRVASIKRGETPPMRCDRCAFCRQTGVLEYCVDTEREI